MSTETPSMFTLNPFEAIQASWLFAKRHWKVLVPGFVVLFLLALPLANLLFRQSDAFRISMDYLRKSAPVLDAVGAPLETGFMVSGSISEVGPTGQAELSVPIVGPKAKAEAFVKLSKDMGVWKIDAATVQMDQTGQRIALVP
jgi:hypothetical protein